MSEPMIRYAGPQIPMSQPVSVNQQENVMRYAGPQIPQTGNNLERAPQNDTFTLNAPQENVMRYAGPQIPQSQQADTVPQDIIQRYAGPQIPQQ